jgi:glycosyltransferase involved in cell wall biosynthesis
MPTRDCFGIGWRNHGIALRSKFSTKMGWHLNRNNYAAIVAVSEYAKQEISTYLHVSKDIIFPVYHGVDLEVFHPKNGSGDSENEAYLLHVSQPQPKKNVDRLVAAYALLDPQERPQLRLVAPGYTNSNLPDGIQLYQSSLKHDELAPLYRGALGFIFPSIHETFGMPILEAMASGCPVITSNTTGCAEIASDAALLVDPRATEDIERAMRRLVTVKELRHSLREKGIIRARQFTWRRSAEQHIAVFEQTLEGKLGGQKIKHY